MTDNFENKVAVDGPVVNEGELGSSTFSPGQVSPAGPLGLGQRWTMTRKREVALRLLRGEPVELLSRQLGVEIFQNWLNRSVQGGPEHAENKVAVDGPTFSPGQVSPADLGVMTRKREVALRLLRGEPVELLSRQLGVEIFRLEQWREKAIAGIDASLKERKGDPVKAELDIAMKRIGELIMQVELLEAKTETSGPLGRRRSRR